MHILSLDLGTSAIKAAVLDVESGRPLGDIARIPYAIESPVPEAAEIQADNLWQAVSQAARAAVAGSGVAGRAGADVAGIGISCLTPALVLLDQRDRPTAPIWTHLDRRSRHAARQVWAAVGEEFLASVGNRPLPGGITAVCFRQQLIADPYLSHRVHSYLHVNGWLALRLTGEKAFDPGNASVTGLFGTMTDRQWSPRWCDYFQVEPAWLPPVLDGATTVGTLRSAAAVELGVPAGIPLKLGVPDTTSAILAAGMQVGDLLHIVGTTQVLAVITPRAEPSPRRITRLLGVGSDYLQAAHNPVGGISFEWIRNLCFREQSEEEFFQRTIAEASRRSTRVSLDPPFLGGDRLEIEAHRAAFRDLELTTDRLDLVAALCQAMVRRHQEARADLEKDRPIRRIFLTGGAADTVRQLIPDYKDATIHRLEEGSLRGVAALFRDRA